METQDKKEQPSTAIAIAPKDEIASAMAQWGLLPSPQGYLTSLPLDTLQAKDLAFRVKIGQHAAMDDFLNKEVDVANWLLSPIDFQDENSGELKRLPLLRVILATGDVIQTTSQVIVRQLLDYHAGVRPAPWHPPWRVKVTSNKGKGPNKYFSLSPITIGSVTKQAAQK